MVPMEETEHRMYLEILQSADCDRVRGVAREVSKSSDC